MRETERQWNLLQGDAIGRLKGLPSKSVQCVITSPPYWGLRDYSRCACATERKIVSNFHTREPTPTDSGGGVLHTVNTEPDPSCPKCHGTGKNDSLNVVWGGEEDCEHRWGEEIDNPHRDRRTSVGGHLGADKEGGGRTAARGQTAGAFCSLCPSWRGQLGLEPTPDLYVQHIVVVFQEVRRVLRDDGTCWINLGDSYASVRSGGTSRTEPQGFQENDSTSTRLCDACEAIVSGDDRSVRTHHQNAPSRGDDSPVPIPAHKESPPSRLASSDSENQTEPRQSSVSTQDQRPFEALSVEQFPDAPESTKPVSSPPPRVECLHCDNCGVCLSVENSSTRDARLCARRDSGPGRPDTSQRWHTSALRNEGKSPSAEAYSGIAPLKQKDLVGMPWMIAFALRNDGWWLRSDIIWAKPNPMPESVTDRPTRSHEDLFLLTKSGTTKYWTHRDLNGTRTKPKADYRWVDNLNDIEYVEKPSGWTKEKIPCQECAGAGQLSGYFGSMECSTCKGKGRVRRWGRINLWRGHDYFYDADAIREPGSLNSHPRGKDGIPALTHKMAPAGEGIRNNPSFQAAMRTLPPEAGRNKRTVWEIATQPYPEAHFATFPEKLVEPCIKAGTPEKGACRVCGSPWERVVEAKPNPSKADFDPDSREWANTHQRTSNPQSSKSLHRNPGGVYREAVTTGFRPSCDHDAESEPALVLDPFCGSGSAGVVAVGLGRRFLGIDIKAEYLAMAERRLRKFPVRLDTFAEVV